MNNTQIVLMTLDYPPERGGVARYLGSLVAASEGAINVIVPCASKTDDPGHVKTAQFFRRRWPRWLPLIQICRTSNRLFPTSSLLVSHVFPVGTAAWISRLLGGPDYSIIFHGLDLKLAAGRWKKWLLNRICNSAKLLIANSEFTKKELLRLLNHRADVVVITPAISDEHYPSREEARRELNLDPDELLVVTVTRLIPRKGLDFSLRAISRLQTHMNVSYIVLGDGSDAERLIKVADECRTKVRWIHDADDEEKKLWLSAADVFLLPAREEKYDVEGFGIVYLEAAAAGIPSVAGRSGGAEEAVVDGITGLVVNPDSINDIAEAVEKLLKHRELRKQLGENAKMRVLKDFRWEDRWILLKKLLCTRLT